MNPATVRHLGWQCTLGMLVTFCVLGFVPLAFGQSDRLTQLTAALGDSDWTVRLDAAFALGRLKDRSTVLALVAALKDTDPDVRRTAATALGEIKDLRAVDPLIATLRDTESQVRACAAKALGQIGDPRAVLFLIPELKDSDAVVRRSAADWLGSIQDPRAVEPLIAALKDPEPDVQFRAARALGKIKDPRADMPFMEALKGKDGPVVSGAYRFFIGLGKEGSEDALIAALNVFGNKEMALDYLKCGNPKLENAGRSWAKRNGYEIVADPNLLFTISVLWGSERPTVSLATTS